MWCEASFVSVNAAAENKVHYIAMIWWLIWKDILQTDMITFSYCFHSEIQFSTQCCKWCFNCLVRFKYAVLLFKLVMNEIRLLIWAPICLICCFLFALPFLLPQVLSLELLLQSKVFSFLFLQLSVWASLCGMMHVQRLSHECKKKKNSPQGSNCKFSHWRTWFF